MTRRMPLRLWLPVFVYMALIFYVSSLPDPPLPSRLSDKAAHSVAYIGLAVLVVRALSGRLGRRIAVRVAVTALVLTAAYGITDEWHQAFVAGRTSDVLDWLADVRGAGIGVAACWVLGLVAER